MRKVHLILIAALASACAGNQEKGSDQVKSSEKLQSDTAPIGYDDMMSQLNNDSSGNKADNPDWQLSVYKDIYPTPKLSKEINDFSALDSMEIQRAYINYYLTVNHYKDSGANYLPFFKSIYQALDKRVEDLEVENRITIKDKLKISKTKSDINTVIAGMGR
jgi:hypothetical protein